jgi:DtxR family Mn-dependent transcriptional regulator
MTLSDRADELLECLWTEIVQQGQDGLDPARIADAALLPVLTEHGLIETTGNRVRLTAHGEAEARACVRRHRLAERLLADVLDLKGRAVHDTGCRFEHMLSKGLDDNICTLLGHPKACPHGQPIPPGPCCGEAHKRRPEKLVMPLTEAALRRRLRVCHLEAADRATLQRLLTMGTLPGTELVLLHRFPSFVFRLGQSQFAVDRELADRIYVRPL